MTCNDCKGKGTTRLPRTIAIPGATGTRRRNERTTACPTCLGSGTTR